MKKLLFIYFFAAIATANAADRWREIRISLERVLGGWKWLDE